MYIIRHYLRPGNYLLLLIALLLTACNNTADPKERAKKAGRKAQKGRTDNTFPEGFESGSKRAYAAGDVPLATGLWHLDNALIGKTEEDAKDGEASLRIAPGGSATMQFDIHEAVKAVSLHHAGYKGIAGGVWTLWCSTDAGATWLQSGSTQHSGALPATTMLPAPTAPAIRFSIHNNGRQRINIDNFDINTAAGGPVTGTGNSANTPGGERDATRDDNMALGNPSGAKTATGTPDNYLLIRPQYALAYNNSKGMANWVSWHLSTAWRGDASRCNCFMPDAALPGSFFKALTSGYIATGFDRGHLCPSEDRDGSADDNAATFLMSNISPQAPLLNQQPWEHLEEYCRALTAQGQELYIMAGGYGFGGSGAKGGETPAIGGGRINVPAHFWKIIVVLPVGSDDLHRIMAKTRVIAVDMPNTQDVAVHEWDYYRTSVDAIEAATGYDFLDKVPKGVQEAVEAGVDGEAIR